MILRFAATTLALALATWLLPGVALKSPSVGEDIVVLVIVAAIFGVANSAVKPLFTFGNTPLLLVALAASLLIANAALLLFTSWVCGLLGVGWHVDDFWSALLGGIIVSVVSFLANSAFGRRGEEHR